MSIPIETMCMSLNRADLLCACFKGVGLLVRSPKFVPDPACFSLQLTLFLGANGVFAETILDLANRKPHLIFKDATPYDIWED